MVFQEEYPYGYEILDYFEKIIGSPLNLFASSSSATLSCTTAEQQSHSTEKLSSLQARGGSGEEPPRKRRRRRTRSEQKKEEKENQRMNHIAVERNRRSQMKHFISILKSMMPLSYSQRSDQASILEGTISYLKKQEQLLQSLESQSKTTKPNQSSNIFSDFFIFPQYSTATASSHHRRDRLPVVADVEVTLVERHVNIKVLTKTRPRLLFKIINEFYSLGLSILHLNLTTHNNMSLFTFSVKVEEDCQLTTTVNEVAKAVHEVVRKIHKEN